MDTFYTRVTTRSTAPTGFYLAHLPNLPASLELSKSAIYPTKIYLSPPLCRDFVYLAPCWIWPTLQLIVNRHYFRFRSSFAYESWELNNLIVLVRHRQITLKHHCIFKDSFHWCFPPLYSIFYTSILNLFSISSFSTIKIAFPIIE